MDSCYSNDPAYGGLVRAFERMFDGRSLPAILFTNSATCLATNDAYGTLSGGAAPLVSPGQSLGAAIVEADDLKPVLQFAREGMVASADLVCTFPDAVPHMRRQSLHFFSFDDGKDMAGLVAHVVPLPQEVEPSDRVDRPLGGVSLADQVLRASLQASGIALWNMCPTTGDSWFSNQFFSQLGYEIGAFDASLSSLLELLHPEDRGASVADFNLVLTGELDRFDKDFRMRRADGSWQWVGVSGGMVEVACSGAPGLICGTMIDITQRKIVEAQLAETAKVATEHSHRLDQIASNSPAGVYEFCIDTHGVGSLPYVSQRALDTLGVTQDDVDQLTDNLLRNVCPEYVAPMNEAIGTSLRDLTEFKMRYELEHPELGRRWIAASSVPERRSDGSTVWFGSVYDVTEDVDREAALQAARDKAIVMTQDMEVLAMRDALTGLPNRRKFDMAVADRRSSGTTRDMTLIRVDLDHFKHVNDNLGHDAGDAVLVHVAKTLLNSVGPDDMVFRIGGDEFSILLGPKGSEAQAEDVVMHVQAALSVPFFFDDQICRFGASFGIALRSDDAMSDAELNTFADVALYEAKARGRNRVVVFTDDLHRHIIDSRRLATELEEALANQEFLPFFQPQICAKTGRLVGLETLARWQHPSRGVLTPDTFMHVAEKIRMMPLLDQMILEKTREVLRDWRSKGFHPPKVSFNVSSGQLQDHAILETARSLIAEGVHVGFELLESVLIEDETDVFRHNLDALKDMGAQIEIDDFGSGHASIIGLMQTDPAVLKIDKRLVSPIEGSAQARHLIAAIVGMARALGIATTAEGVESVDQVRLLREMGCDVLQGYFFSRPVDPDALFEFAQGYRARAS